MPGKRAADELLDVVAGADFDQLWDPADDVLLAGVGAHGQVHARVVQVLFVVDGGGVDVVLHHLQRQRHEVGGHHGFQQEAQLLIEFGEAPAQIFVIVERQIARVNRCEKVVSEAPSAVSAANNSWGWQRWP